MLTVKIPIGYRCYANRTIDHLIDVLHQHHGGHVTSVSVAHYADFRLVYVFQFFTQISEHRQLILNLYGTDPAHVNSEIINICLNLPEKIG